MALLNRQQFWARAKSTLVCPGHCHSWPMSKKKWSCCGPNKLIPIFTFCRRSWKTILDYLGQSKMFSTNASRYDQFAVQVISYILEFPVLRRRSSKIGNTLNCSWPSVVRIKPNSSWPIEMIKRKRLRKRLLSGRRRYSVASKSLK